MTKWQYKTIKFEAQGFTGGKIDEGNLNSILNDLGTQGWELVVGLDTNFSGGQTRDVVMTFKRQAQ